MFQVEAEGVNVMVDTLATTPAGEPLSLVTKCGVIPHLNMVIAGTGLAQLPDRWRETVYGRMLARDIDLLDRHTPSHLRNLWTDLIAEFPSIDPEGITSTVYHFGLSESTGRYVGYAYRSASDFISEPMLQGGFGVKPAPEPPLVLKPPTDLAEWIECAIRLRAQQSIYAKAARVHIGGDLVFYTLHNGETSLSRVHRFDDFEANWQAMNGALNV